jgi:hypothetical protein
MQKIDRALKIKETWKETFRIPLCYDYFEGRQRPPEIPAHEWVTINLIYSNLMSMLPSLYQTSPYFYVKLRQSFTPNVMDIALYEQQAKIRGAMLNYLKDTLNLKVKARLSISDALFQYGIFKVHYTSEMVENPDGGNPVIDDNGLPLTNENGEILKEPKQIPIDEAYAVTRIHPDDHLVDEDAGPLDEDVHWHAQRIKMTLEEVRRDKRFKSSVRNSIKATEISDPIQKEREQKKKGGLATSSDKSIQPDTVVMWEIYDLDSEEWMVASEGSDDFLIDPEPVPKGIDKHPFVDLRFTMRDDSWYPLPPISQWIDPQKEYCILRSKLAVHRKRFNRKYLAMKGLILPEEVSKVEIGDDGTIAWQEQMGGPALTPIQDAPLDQSHIQELALLRDELTLMAVGPNQTGSGRGVESATEAGIIEQRIRIQEGDWIGVVVDFIQNVARKLDQQVEANITRDQAVRVTGPQGEFWELVRKDDYQEINGEFQYTINVGAMTPQLPEIERSQWLAFLNLLASAPQLALSKQLLKHMADLHHIDNELMVDEIYNIARQMMSGALPMPGTQGSAPGSPGMPGAGPMGVAMGGNTNMMAGLP